MNKADEAFEQYKKQLRQVQLVQLGILKEIDRICKKNRIAYFLDSGTLLGAVRHQGFIPWDDDLDVGMTRDNYTKFMKIVSAEIDEKYYCLNWYENRDYGLNFAKIKKKNTVYVENINRKSKYPEVFVDIFPYDCYPNRKIAKITQGYPLLALRAIIKIKSGNMPWTGGGIMKKMKYIPSIACSKLLPGKWMIRQYERIAQKYNKDSTCEWMFPQGISRYGKWILRREWLNNLGEIQFEDGVFPCPSDWNMYLKHAYGDYMTLPPEEKRWNRHQILQIKLGDDNIGS